MVPQDGPRFLRTKRGHEGREQLEKGQQKHRLGRQIDHRRPVEGGRDGPAKRWTAWTSRTAARATWLASSRKLTALGVVPVLPPSPPVKNVEPLVEKPKALDMLFVELPSVELVNLQAENQKLREQIAGTPKSQPFGFVFWSVFALLCGVSALYGGEFKRNRVLKTRVEILRASRKKESGDLEVTGRDSRALNLEISALQMRSNELPRAVLAAKEGAASLSEDSGSRSASAETAARG